PRSRRSLGSCFSSGSSPTTTEASDGQNSSVVLRGLGSRLDRVPGGRGPARRCTVNIDALTERINRETADLLTQMQNCVTSLDTLRTSTPESYEHAVRVFKGIRDSLVKLGDRADSLALVFDTLVK